MNTIAEDLYLSPGDFRFETRPVRLRTVLGSCVGVTLWHPGRKIGAMCHFMLPSRPRKSTALNGKYGDEAIELFLRQALAHHTAAEDYQLKLFGGGEMFPGIRQDTHSNDVAQMNVSAALEMADHYHLDLIAQDMGSTGHRNVIFDTSNGHVWVSHKPIRTRTGNAQEKN
ncbi:chemotaxis protein CheD [Pseudomonas sp. DWP3-1-2]|uniref:chemotaxis protein CheD n=1 Tax=Pseudomonas sp. DWP3-1-2 TaxID=2804645 RepID=UPI003CF0026E